MDTPCADALKPPTAGGTSPKPPTEGKYSPYDRDTPKHTDAQGSQ